MNDINATLANDARLPDGALERLALFAEWTGTTPPKNPVTNEGGDLYFSDELLSFADESGLSLDWFWLGDERGLVIGAHNHAKGAVQ